MDYLTLEFQLFYEDFGGEEKTKEYAKEVVKSVAEKMQLSMKRQFTSEIAKQIFSIKNNKA